MRLTFESLGGWFPVPVLVLNRMPARLIGLSLGVIVVVRSDYADDRPTIVHELEHCKQFWRGGLVWHMVRYYASRDYRLRTELEAFQAELRACSADQYAERLHESVRVLASCYEIGLDEHDCRALLCGAGEAASAPSVALATPRIEESAAAFISDSRPSPVSPVAARSAAPSRAV